MLDRFGRNPVVAVLVLVVTLIAVVGLLQLSPSCREWREWRAFKQGPGPHTDELLIPPFYCIGSREP